MSLWKISKIYRIIINLSMKKLYEIIYFQANNIVQSESTGLPILKFVSIKREDTGEFAIPGGMCDPGENVSQSLKREFGEEALNTDAFPER